MTSRHNFHLVKLEVEEDHMLEEEEEAHKKVEEKTLQNQVEGVAIKIQVNVQAKIKHKVRDDPIHFENVVKEEKWIAAMKEEIEAIENNETWELMNLPQGKEVIGVKWVYKTKRNIEGKIERIDAYLLDKGFDKCDGEPTLYIKESDGKLIIVVLYVDDLILTGSDDFLIVDFKEVMNSEFEMTDLGLLRYFLGIEMKQRENGIFISQEKFVAYILERFNIQNSKPAPTPTAMGLKLSKEDCKNNANSALYKSMIGNLMYLTTTWPDIMYEVSLVSRFMETPKEIHWQATKRSLRYFKGKK
eukprot:PITA_30210